jgi:hypothetical protein
MMRTIRQAIRHTIESPASGLVTAGVVWAVAAPWLAHRRRHVTTAG